MARRSIESDDMGELWREHRRAQQERRAERLPTRTEEILALRADNFHVRQLTEYQFRVDGRLDLYPIHRLYHDVTRNKRGTYQTAKQIAIRILRAPEASV